MNNLGVLLNLALYFIRILSNKDPDASTYLLKAQSAGAVGYTSAKG